MGHIVAMGGGGFSEDVRELDDYVLHLAATDHPHVGFLATGSGDSPGYIERFYDAFTDRACPSHLRLFPMPSRNVESWIVGLDVVYVGGGSTANLLAVWRAHGLDRLLRDAHGRGAVLAGVSAGGMCWFEAGITDSFGPYRPLLDGLSIASGSFTPHYDADEQRRAVLHTALRAGFPSGYAVDDAAAVHLADGLLSTAVSARRGACAYQVSVTEDEIIEEQLDHLDLDSSA
jgi:dipeptidase E